MINRRQVGKYLYKYQGTPNNVTWHWQRQRRWKGKRQWRRRQWWQRRRQRRWLRQLQRQRRPRWRQRRRWRQQWKRRRRKLALAARATRSLPGFALAARLRPLHPRGSHYALRARGLGFTLASRLCPHTTIKQHSSGRRRCFGSATTYLPQR